MTDFTWAVRFPRLNVDEARRLWRVAGVEVHDDGGEIVWLAGRELSEQVDAILRGFLSGKRFLVLPDRQIQSPQERVPRGYLPDGEWIPFRKWMDVELPQAALAGELPGRLRLRLVRSTAAQEPNLLVTDAASWARYGAHAPQIRLQGLRFAVHRVGRVLVLGQPLPSIAGERFVDYGGVAVAAGWIWDPPFSVEVLAEGFRLRRGDLVMAQSDGTWQRILSDQFVAATRQAIRQSTTRCCGND